MEELLKQVFTCNTVKEARKLILEYFPANKTILKAVDLAVEKHEGQFRKSGEPYVVHPILVSTIVAEYGGDEAMVIAALLHDVVEDTDCSVEDVNKMFGDEVSKLVEGLTKIVAIREDKLLPSGSGEKLIASAMSFRKMLVASIDDVRVLVIKLCDRLHNMGTLSALRPDKQKRIAEETLFVYVPIAHRLGISSIKNYLEDLSFFYVLPEEYKKINDYLVEHQQQLQLRLNLFVDKINTLMLQNGFNENEFTLEKRIKHHYSIYLKMQRKGTSIEEVLDLLAIRILTKEPLDCYKVLGIMHTNFNPIISRFKDYIGIPKDNGYQTIHTTIFDDKSIIEAQIRTFDMHKVAEFGIAAHWKYKSSGGMNPKLDWLNEIKNQNDENEDITEFYQLAKENLFSEDIAVFSPKGDIFTLPRGATVLDFAYEVHTEIGSHTKEAYINRQKVPLLTELKNGDIVRIVTSEEEILRCSWVYSVKTGKARSAILQGCKQKLKELNYKVAIDILLGVFNARENKLLAWIRKENLSKKISRVAIDSIYLQDVVNQLKKYSRADKILLPLLKIDRHNIKKQKFENIVVYSNLHVNSVIFDYCCHPKRGDDIVGFMKKSGDVTVHHKMCEKANKILDNKEQTVVFVKWTRDAPRRYKIILKLENKRGSLAAFLLYLAKMQVNLQTIELGKSDEGVSDYFRLVIEIPEEANPDNIRENLQDKYNIIDFVSLNDAYKN
ncbi:MAG: RelA/SpoT family protein [Campylobacteraceae bacterium]